MTRWVALTAFILFMLWRRGFRVQFKEGVVTAFAPELARALPAIEAAHRAVGIERGAFITSGTEGRHMAGSLHYAGRALDLRTRDLHADQLVELLYELRARLGSLYDVVDESWRQDGPHVHVEYDPR